MKKIAPIFLFLLAFSSFYSQKFVFRPNFDNNKTYSFKITEEELAADEFKEKTFHNVYITKVNFRILQEVGDNYICSWKIISYKKIDKKDLFETNLYDFLEGLEIKFKISVNGDYIAISNSTQLSSEIKGIITDDYVKNFKKKSSKNKSEVNNLLELKKNPELAIKILEKHIINYFRYYNVSFRNHETNSLIRKDLVFSNYILPYQCKINLENSDAGYFFSIDSKLDRQKMNDENWDSVYKGASHLLDQFKESYDISVAEKYYFSTIGNVFKIEISAKEKFNYSNNIVRYSNFALSLE